MNTNTEHFPVHSEYRPDGWESTGIDYSDYARMSKLEHKLGGWRRKATPTWAINDGQLREVITRFLEGSAQVAKVDDTQQARMERAEKLLVDEKPHLVGLLDSLCKEYVEAKRSSAPAQRLRELEIQIEGLDTRICLIGLMPAKLAGVVHFYYRMGMNSVEVGRELDLKPPHVRQLLYRLNKVADQIAEGAPQIGGYSGRQYLTSEVTPATKCEPNLKHGTSLGIPLERARADAGGNPSYASYIEFAATIGTLPLPLSLWGEMASYVHRVPPHRW